MTWTFNKDYRDLGQVADFYPAYMKIFEELREAGQYPYNDLFKGRIPGIEGPSEDTAIYLLQNTRHLAELDAKVIEYRKAGWRDLTRGELDGGPVRYAGVAQYAHCVGGTGWTEWGDARLKQTRTTIAVLPGRNRTNGHIIAGRLLVKD